MDRRGPVANPTIIDAHQHFWIYNSYEYGWMGDGMDGLKRDFLPPDLGALLRQVGVHGTVAVQARRTVSETAWLLELADRHPFILGVVGWADFAADDVSRVLAGFADHPRLVGFRELIHDMPARDYALSRDHVSGVRSLGEYGLTYDLLVRPEHLEVATSLVDLFPEQRFVVDHIAKPRFPLDEPGLSGADVAGQGPRGEDRQLWARGIREIARRANVFCKLSGVLTEFGGPVDRAHRVTPFLDAVLEAFGPSRVMIGSDWPVCTCAADYGATMEFLIRYVSKLSTDEQEAVLSGACVEAYGLRGDVASA